MYSLWYVVIPSSVDLLTKRPLGIFLVTFGLCLYILGWKRQARHVNVPMALTAVLLFACSTMHVSIDLARILDAFHTYGELAGGPVAFLGNVRNVTHVMKSAVYITETCISDALVVYVSHTMYFSAMN